MSNEYQYNSWWCSCFIQGDAGGIKQFSTIIMNILISYPVTFIRVRIWIKFTLPFHIHPASSLCCQLMAENQQHLPVCGPHYKMLSLLQILEDFRPTLFPPLWPPSQFSVKVFLPLVPPLNTWKMAGTQPTVRLHDMLNFAFRVFLRYQSIQFWFYSDMTLLSVHDWHLLITSSSNDVVKYNISYLICGLHYMIRSLEGHVFQERNTYTSYWTGKLHSETFIIKTHVSYNM